LKEATADGKFEGRKRQGGSLSSLIFVPCFAPEPIPGTYPMSPHLVEGSPPPTSVSTTLVVLA